MAAALLVLAAFLLLSSGAGAAGGPEPVPVVVTTDCGADMDDQWAIAHAALSPALRTLAVVGGFAPAPHDLGGEDTARCAREALGAVGRLADVPVHAGADGRLRDRATPARNAGVERLIGLARGFSPERRLTVLALGPATDIASAVLLDPGFADRVEVVAMAFDAYPEGGDGWNASNDVAAWQVLLDSPIPVTVASGGAALAHLSLRRGEADALVGHLGPAGAHLARLHAAWLDAIGDAFAAEVGAGSWPVWDEATVAVLLGMAAVRERPRPALGDDTTFAFPNARSGAPFRWVDRIDRGRLLGDLAGLLAATDPGRPATAARTATPRPRPPTAPPRPAAAGG